MLSEFLHPVIDFGARSIYSKIYVLPRGSIIIIQVLLKFISELILLGYVKLISSFESEISITLKTKKKKSFTMTLYSNLIKCTFMLWIRLPITLSLFPFSDAYFVRPIDSFNCKAVLPLAPTPTILKTAATLKGEIKTFSVGPWCFPTA